MIEELLNILLLDDIFAGRSAERNCDTLLIIRGKQLSIIRRKQLSIIV